LKFFIKYFEIYFEEVTKANNQNIIQQENKKTSEENGWLSKTGISNDIKNKTCFFFTMKI
jgi:hypothetical protein